MNVLLRNRNLIPLSSSFTLLPLLFLNTLSFLSSTSHTISPSIYLPVSISHSPRLSLSDSVPSVWSMELILFRKFSHDGFFFSLLCLCCIFLIFFLKVGVAFVDKSSGEAQDVLLLFIKHSSILDVLFHSVHRRRKKRLYKYLTLTVFMETLCFISQL